MKKVIAILSIITFSISVFALDLSFTLTPQLIFPKDSNFDKSFNGTVAADAHLFNLLSVGIEGTYLMSKPKGMEKKVSIYGGGLGVGAFYSPISRLYLGAGGAFGIYSLSSPIIEEKTSDFYWRGYGEVGFRINPTFTVCATGGYSSYLVKGHSPVIQGPYAGVSLKINTSVGNKSSGACDVDFKQEGTVYPLFQQVYRQSPVGSVVVTNGESAEIRNVYVSFRAGKYTSSALKSEKINLIKPMGKVELPLYVDFSSELLKFSENGKLSGEVVIEYEIVGKKKVSVQPIAISVSNRNSYIWGNNESLAAFVSSETPEILEYAKYVAGIARNDLYTGMNRNIQFAAAMFEALRSSGITYSGDKTTPYSEYHSNGKIDSIQYPLQTMNYLGGDLDDIGILLASCLESVGVSTGFLPLDDDFIVLVGMDIKPSQAGNHFGDVEGLIIDEDNVFFALSMANFSKGFVKSRSEGAKLVKDCLNNEDAYYEFIPIHDVWTVYPPAIYTGSGSTLEKPTQNSVIKNMTASIKDYINVDLDAVIRNAKSEGNTNKIGMAYVRSGDYSSAINEFNKGAEKGNISSMNNMGNVLLIKKDYVGAAYWFKRVLAKDPENATAKAGLENANSKL